tara:strand:+ start:50 stop:1234 length:1185 start_codon:yes stop_codon:yes gene_type:complete
MKIVIPRFDFIILCLLFSFFLFPISTSNGISINYSFALFPMVLILFKNNLKLHKSLIYIIFYYLIIALYGIISRSFLDDSLVIRTITSFLIFISIFLYSFIDIDSEKVKIFKLSILLVSIIFSLVSIFNFFSLGGNEIAYELKDLIGTQRFGFILILGFFLLLHFNFNTYYFNSFKILFLTVIFIGIGLTFSRASIIALLIVLTIFLTSKLNFKKINFLKFLFSSSALILISSVMLYYLYNTFPFVFLFFDEWIIGRFFNPDYDLLDFESSEGMRIYLYLDIITYVLKNPINGSSFLGVWFIDSLANSAHNQYLDVLFRTGFIGFLIYIYLIFKISNFLYLYDKGLFWGFLGILFYGLFHETFKESQGAFIFSFLLGVTFNYNIKKNVKKILYK